MKNYLHPTHRRGAIGSAMGFPVRSIFSYITRQGTTRSCFWTTPGREFPASQHRRGWRAIRKGVRDSHDVYSGEVEHRDSSAAAAP